MKTLNISLSALNSFSKVQDVVANNVANINTDGYSARRVRLEELPNNQGVRAEEVREEDTRQPERLNENRTNLPQNNVELAREFTEMIQNQNAYNANAQVVRTENQMVGELINKLV